LKNSEYWENWDPIEGLEAKYYIDSINDGVNGLEIILSGAKDNAKRIKFIFSNSVESYKRTDETYRQELLFILQRQYQTDIFAHRTFFKVKNSPYLRWLSEESEGIADDRPLQHLVILAADSSLDIISTYEQEVYFLKD